MQNGSGRAAPTREESGLPALTFRQAQKRRLRLFARKIKANDWASEKWFRDLWERQDLFEKGDRWNRPIGPFIADLINRRLRFVIEVDGSIHDRPEQQAKDRKKDAYLRGAGFRVFRVRAFDMDSFWKTAIQVRAIHQRLGRIRRG